MAKNISSLFLSMVGLWLTTVPLAGATRPTSWYKLGNDVSYPQCTFTFPTPGSFVVVGVNGGTPYTKNQCLQKELKWAATSAGIAGRPGTSLYVNTSEPGSTSRHWPINNIDQISHVPAPNPYGSCSGQDTQSCAWQYGWDSAHHDAAGLGVQDPQAFPWWLDVESGNTWQTRKSLNLADLLGMTDYFQSLGVVVGLYSSWVQWPRIVGTVAATNPLSSLPEWVTGSDTKIGAEQFCTQGGFIDGPYAQFSQWYTPSSTFDSDVTCPKFTFRKIRDPN
jgi:hypothetical protein